jgi:hypothetical protein
VVVVVPAAAATAG